MRHGESIAKSASKVFRAELERRRDELVALQFVTARDVARLASDTYETIEELLGDASASGRALATIHLLRGLAGTPEAAREDEALRTSGIQLIAGSLHVGGDLSNDGVLAVTGDLVVDGSYFDGPGFAQLIVGGAMEVEHTLAAGAIQVGGDLRAKGLVLVRGNDHELAVGGELSASALVEDDKSVRFGTLRCGRHLKSTMGLETVLVADVFDPTGALVRDALEARMRDRLPVLCDAQAVGAAALSPRLATLADLARSATEWHFEPSPDGRSCLVLRLADGSKRQSFLGADERSALEATLGPAQAANRPG